MIISVNFPLWPSGLSDDLIALYEKRASVAAMKDYSGWPLLCWREVSDDPRAAWIRTLVVSTEGKIGAGQYLETALLAGLGVGGHHIAHADNRRREGEAWVPNHTPQRSFSAMVYLNSDFGGGELNFPGYGKTIKPSIGLMVAFLSDVEHEVFPVTAGKRYSLNLWFTEDPNRELKL